MIPFLLVIFDLGNRGGQEDREYCANGQDAHYDQTCFCGYLHPSERAEDRSNGRHQPQQRSQPKLQRRR